MTASEYVAARRVLLDALGALHDHLDNLILVGAQAIYLHAGDDMLNVPPMTTDADLALNTQQLAGQPEIAQTLVCAGFSPSTNPGHWLGAMDGPSTSWWPPTRQEPHRRTLARLVSRPTR